MSGYVKAYRDRFEHKLFRPSKDAPFCKLAAWDWMVARACWRATEYDVRGKTVLVERGQFVASPDEMATAWGWSRGHVRRFLSRLQTDHMIGQETGQHKTLVTICNYDKYQDSEADTGQMCGHNIGHKSATNRPAKEEEEEGKKRKRGSIEPLARGRARKPEVPIPENWTPSDRNLADAAAHYFSPQETAHEADRFRDHHLARGSLFRDWDAAWRTWLGNARRFNGSRIVAGPSPSGGSGSGGTLASIAARRRAEGKV